MRAIKGAVEVASFTVFGIVAGGKAKARGAVHEAYGMPRLVTANHPC
jgi:hypothetical protein